MSEATNVGSIVGTLKIDSSEWDRELAAAEEKAHQLGRVSPKIKVETTGTKQAIAELAAVEVAEKKVELQETKASASSSALARMRAQGRAVTMAQAIAEKETTKSVMDFTQWTQRSADAVAKDTVEKKKNNDATKESFAPMHLLYSSLAALAPAAVPLAGYAAAGAGAFAMLGVTGILAIKGISDEIKNAGPLATQFSEGINTLKEQIGALSRSSAVGMLDGFNRSIATLDAYMPGLTEQTGAYSRVLGNLGANTLAGLLGTFRTLDPVFRAFTGYLGDLTQRFAHLGSNGGLQSFGDYALSVMPRVQAMLESLVAGVGNLLVALAPLGNVGIAVLKGIGDVLTAIPHEVLTLLVSGALAAYGAFSMWTNLIPIIQAFGLMLDVSLGPIGLVVAGVGALIGVMIGAAASTKDNTSATMGYTAALARDNGIIADNVRAHAAQEIAQSKAGEAAQKLGLSLELLKKAATGDVVAQERLGNELQRLDRISKDSSNTTASMGGVNVDVMKKNQAMQASIKDVREELGNQSSALQSAVDYQKRFDEAMGSTNASAGAQHSELSKLAGMYGTSVANIQGAQDAESKTADQLAATTVQMQMQNDAGGLLKMQLDLLSGKSLSFEQAQNGFERQLISSTTAMKTNGTAIDGNSEAAVNNRGSILGMVQSAQQSAEAYGTMTGKSEDARAKLGELRQKIIDSIPVTDANRGAVEKYVDSILKIPPVKPTKIELDAAAAQQKLDDIAWRLDQMQTHKTIFIDVQQSTSNVDNTGGGGHVPMVKPYAKGGMVNYLAGGGFPQFTPKGTDTVPAMLTPGEIVINKPAVDSIGADKLLHANRTGQLPSGGGAAQLPPIYIQNPFTGEYLLAQVDGRVGAGISAANQDAGRRAAR